MNKAELQRELQKLVTEKQDLEQRLRELQWKISQIKSQLINF
jgi:chaperonin cofactor prefoldin